jgi:hypothetical protein
VGITGWSLATAHAWLFEGDHTIVERANPGVVAIQARTVLFEFPVIVLQHVEDLVDLIE